ADTANGQNRTKGRGSRATTTDGYTATRKTRIRHAPDSRMTWTFGRQQSTASAPPTAVGVPNIGELTATPAPPQLRKRPGAPAEPAAPANQPPSRAQPRLPRPGRPAQAAPPATGSLSPEALIQ
ncbi:hypothetical protein E4U53_004661, partial [Claviceps sorghi]